MNFLVLLIVTIVTIGINIAGILSGVTIVLAHLLYFPIILAAYWYPRRFYPFLLLIAGLYGFLILYINYPPDFALFAATVLRILVFTVVGLIVSFLSFGMRRSEQQLNDIIEFLPDATFAIDNEGRVIAWNKAIEDLTGVRKADILNKGNYEYAIPFYGERRPVLIDLALTGDSDINDHYPEILEESGKCTSDVLIPKFRGQSGVYLHFSATTLRDPLGNVTGAIESIRDVTDNIITQSALSNTTSKLNTLSGIIRTEISGKLSLISECLDTGEAEFSDPSVLKFIKSIKKIAGEIKRRLDVSFDFKDIGNKPAAWLSVQDEVLKAAEQLNFGSIHHGFWTERLEVFADPHLSLVFFHLFDNALKFREGLTQVVITYQISDDHCHIIVEDDGPGIDYFYKETLFNQETAEGYGRALYLSHEILSITDIEILENGIPGTGARFELIVPPGGFRLNDDIDQDESPEESETPSTREMPERPEPVSRELTADEFVKADVVWTDYHNTTGDPERDRIFGVFLGDELVSLARCRRHRDGFEVDGVFTPDEYRKKGYSHMAVGSLVEACHNDDLYMYAVIHLRDFYSQYGFIEIPVKEFPEGIRDRYLWAEGNLEGAGVVPMIRVHSDYSQIKK